MREDNHYVPFNRFGSSDFFFGSEKSVWFHALVGKMERDQNEGTVFRKFGLF